MALYKDWLEEDGLTKIEAWARDGLTIEQIASNMGINDKTLYQWKNKYIEISKALKRGKEVVDIQVENALLKRAMGYSYDEVTKERVIDIESGEIKIVVTKVVTKLVNPDVTAQIYWLKNRKRETWKDKWEPDNDEALVKLDEILALAKKDAKVEVKPIVKRKAKGIHKTKQS